MLEKIVFVIWYGTLALTVAFYVLIYCAPQRTATLQSMPWAFHFSRSLDFDFQSVLYTAYHGHWFSRVTHYTFALDQVAWFVVAMWLHPLCAPILLCLVSLQTRSARSVAFTAFTTLVWLGLCGAAESVVRLLGMEHAKLVAVVVLLLGGVLRLVGHVVEPIPPRIVEDSNRFVPLREARPSAKLALTALLGYVSEFAAGFPFRLILVQLSWASQALGLGHPGTLSWGEVSSQGREIRALGWDAYPPVAALLPPPGEAAEGKAETNRGRRRAGSVAIRA